MANVTRLLLSLAVLLVLGACSSNSDPLEMPDLTVPDLVDDGSGVSCLGMTCTTAADCGKTGPCVVAINCLDGCCSYTYAEAGTACDAPCGTGGVCNGGGECLDTTPTQCEEEDGNPCTEPVCDSKSGTCVEQAVADGTAPMDSYCWEGIVCQGGEIDESAATPSALKTQCDGQNEAINPLGCVEQIICVDSEPECVVQLKDEESQCWSGSGGTSETCQGYSCDVDGSCVKDDAYTVTCGLDSYPEECDAVCQECTTLTCHWIADPASPDNGSKRVKYCQLEAQVGDACDDGNDCTEGDACVLLSQTDGPLGKETLGECTSGEGKTKEECLEEMDKPNLPCLKAGTTCDEVEGCGFDQQAADEWCYPPASVCFNKAQTYCTHLGLDDNWDEETGCHIVIFNEEGCNDSNPCTQDTCDDEGGCVYEPLTGGECDDADASTTDDACNNGECVGLPDPDQDGVANSGYNNSCAGGETESCNDNCPNTSNSNQADANGDGIGDACTCVPDCAGKQCGDDGCGGSCGQCFDDNPCTDDICLDGGTCSYPAANEGALCEWPGLCKGKCTNGFCVESAQETCNGQDDDCDQLIDEDPGMCPNGYVCQNGQCVQDCVPINGGWSDWSCGACSEPCGGGIQTCNRYCNNPPPSCGGLDCAGSSTTTEACNTQSCVDYLPTGTTVYTTGEQMVTGVVPAGKSSILFKMWGGGGGGGAPGGGGGGAYVQGTLNVSPGDEIEIRVGGGGEEENGGGGGSYVFRNGVAVMIAAGGGGGGSDGCSGCSKDYSALYGSGGGGGAIGGVGQAGTENNKYNCGSGGGGGGSQGAGGAAGQENDQSQYSGCSADGEAGSAHTGGRNHSSQCNLSEAATYHAAGENGGGNGSGGGGGAGYFGGGSGAAKYTYCGGGGGGGSSWVQADFVSGTYSEGGNYTTPGGTGISGYQGNAGKGGQGQTDPFDDPQDSQPGNPGMIIMTL